MCGRGAERELKRDREKKRGGCKKRERERLRLIYPKELDYMTIRGGHASLNLQGRTSGKEIQSGWNPAGIGSKGGSLSLSPQVKHTSPFKFFQPIKSGPLKIIS